MSILTSSSGASVSRGFYYYKYGKLNNVKQINDLKEYNYKRYCALYKKNNEVIRKQ
ncbi:MAG: hypothetical protein IKF82_03825 [Bacilli bacterium]|nr:hypothetical protein [Bacilli bacterium]